MPTGGINSVPGLDPALFIPRNKCFVKSVVDPIIPPSTKDKVAIHPVAATRVGDEMGSGIGPNDTSNSIGGIVRSEAATLPSNTTKWKDNGENLFQTPNYGPIDTATNGLRLCALNKGSGSLRWKLNNIETHLRDNDIDVLGISEATIKGSDDLKDMRIKGYKLEVDRGRKEVGREMARVAVYIKEGVQYEVVKKYNKGTVILPEVWLRLGTVGKGNTILVGTVYREHQPWTTKKQGDQSQKLQEDRWSRWLKCKEEIWTGREEAYLMGDLNLDLASDKNKKNMTMKGALFTTLRDRGWQQIVEGYTRIVTTDKGKQTKTLIDHIWTNRYKSVVNTNIIEIGWSDHDAPWVEIAKQKHTEKKESVRRRVRTVFSEDRLNELGNKISWDWSKLEEVHEFTRARPKIKENCKCKRKCETLCCDEKLHDLAIQEWKEDERIANLEKHC